MVCLKSTTRKLRLILDTNIVFSALINKKSTIRDILLSDRILFLFTLFYLLSKVNIVKRDVFSGNLEKARKIMEKIDIYDSEFLALAFSVDNEGIFSKDRDFDKSGIKRWSVEELLEWLARK